MAGFPAANATCHHHSARPLPHAVERYHYDAPSAGDVEARGDVTVCEGACGSWFSAQCNRGEQLLLVGRCHAH